MKYQKFLSLVFIMIMFSNLLLFQYVEKCQAIPSAPSGFTATVFNRTRIDLAWTNAGSNKTYVESNSIEHWALGSGTFLYNGTGTSFQHAGLSPGTVYYYQAWSWNVTDSVYSATNVSDNDTTLSNSLPAFSGFTVSNGSSDLELSLFWNVTISDDDGDSFDWSIECNNSQSSNAVGADNGSKQLSLSGLSYSTFYTVWVNVTDSYDAVNEWFVFTTRSQFGPSAPSDFTAVADGRFEIDLSWNDDIEADSTRVEWSSVADGTWDVNDHTVLYNDSDEVISHSGLSPGTQRFYKAWSWNATDSIWSSGVTDDAITDSNNAPVLVSHSPSNGSVDQDLSFVWNITISDFDGDSFDWSIECNNSQSSNAVGADNGSKQLSLSGLSYSTFYTVWVNVTDSYDAVNEWFNFTTITTHPPKSFNAIAYSKSQIDLSWIIGNYSDATYIEWNLTSGPWIRGNGKELYNGSGNSTSHTGLNSGKTYYYSAWSWNSTEEHWSLSNSFDSAKTKSSGGSSGGGGGVPPPIDEEEQLENSSSENTISEIEEHFNIYLEVPFYANDTDGDGLLDEFNDPNGMLIDLNSAIIEDYVVFLISIDNDDIPEFLWNPIKDTIILIENIQGLISGTLVETVEDKITVIVNVSKPELKWIFIVVFDQYTYIETLIIKTSDGRNISSDRIIRKNGLIYILDDPEINYQLIYNYPLLESISYPVSGAIFNTTKPTITITCQEIVRVINATFGPFDIIDQIITLDNMKFIFTPKSDLVNGLYVMNITLQDINNENFTLESLYEIKITDEKKDEKDNGYPWMILLIIVFLIIIFAILILFKIGFLYIEVEEEEKD